MHDRGWVVECGDRLAPTRAAVLVFGRPRYVRQALPRPVVDCQFIGAAYDHGSPERHWFERIVVEENLLQAWTTVVEHYMRHAEIPFRLDPRTMHRIDQPPGYEPFREAVVNLLIHQDYGDHGRTPFIRSYYDRTVFWNPGDAGAPAEELLERTAKEVAQPADRGGVPRHRPRQAGGHRTPGHLPRLAGSRSRGSGDPQRRGPERVRAVVAGEGVGGRRDQGAL